MKLKNLKQVKKGKFLSSYELTYEDLEGNNKVYEMVSREGSLCTEKIGEKIAGVIIAAFKDDKVLLLKEFRMGVNRYVYSFAAGLIDEGETPEETAKRELKEETGMDITEILDVLPPSFSCSGVTDEKTVVVFAKADGEFCKSTSPNEEISAGLFTKSQVKELLNSEDFASRTQGILYMWTRS